MGLPGYNSRAYRLLCAYHKTFYPDNSPAMDVVANLLFAEEELKTQKGLVYNPKASETVRDRDGI